MRTIGAYEAKTNFSRLLEQAEQGESVTITKHGREVARLVPVRRDVFATDEIVDALRASRRGVTLGRSSIRRMIEEGRR